MEQEVFENYNVCLQEQQKALDIYEKLKKRCEDIRTKQKIPYKPVTETEKKEISKCEEFIKNADDKSVGKDGQFLNPFSGRMLTKNKRTYNDIRKKCETLVSTGEESAKSPEKAKQKKSPKKAVELEEKDDEFRNKCRELKRNYDLAKERGEETIINPFTKKSISIDKAVFKKYNKDCNLIAEKAKKAKSKVPSTRKEKTSEQKEKPTSPKKVAEVIKEKSPAKKSECDIGCELPEIKERLEKAVTSMKKTKKPFSKERLNLLSVVKLREMVKERNIPNPSKLKLKEQLVQALVEDSKKRIEEQQQQPAKPITETELREKLREEIKAQLEKEEEKITEVKSRAASAEKMKSSPRKRQLEEEERNRLLMEQIEKEKEERQIIENLSRKKREEEEAARIKSSEEELERRVASARRRKAEEEGEERKRVSAEKRAEELERQLASERRKRESVERRRLEEEAERKRVSAEKRAEELERQLASERRKRESIERRRLEEEEAERKRVSAEKRKAEKEELEEKLITIQKEMQEGEERKALTPIRKNLKCKELVDNIKSEEVFNPNIINEIMKSEEINLTVCSVIALTTLMEMKNMKWISDLSEINFDFDQYQQTPEFISFVKKIKNESKSYKVKNMEKLKTEIRKLNVTELIKSQLEENQELEEETQDVIISAFAEYNYVLIKYFLAKISKLNIYVSVETIIEIGNELYELDQDEINLINESVSNYLTANM
jgi:hypothetical protein